MKIFITGGTGFIGKAVVSKLLERRHKLLLLSRKNLIKKERGITYLKGDLEVPEIWEKSFQKFKPDAVIHLAWEGLSEHDYGSEISLKNFKNTLNIIFLAEKSGVKKFLSVGSSWEYGRDQGKLSEKDSLKITDHVPYFLAAKRSIQFLGNQLALQGKMQFLWCRLFFVYGPGQRSGALIPYIVNSFSRGITPDIKNKVGGNDFIFVEDAADAIVKILENEKHKSTVYNIGSGKLVSVARVANLAAKELKKTPFLEEPRQPKGFYADISKIKGFGWHPKTSIELGVKKTIKYLKK